MFLIDNTVLSNFALIGELNLLQDYSKGKGAITDYVLAEFERGVKERIFINTNLDWLEVLTLVEYKEKFLFEILCKRLGAGESSCLAISSSRGYDLLSDDMAVRKIAMREGIRLSGSIGVLLELIRINRISAEKGNTILKGFIKHGYFSPSDKLDELL